MIQVRLINKISQPLYNLYTVNYRCLKCYAYVNKPLPIKKVNRNLATLSGYDALSPSNNYKF